MNAELIENDTQMEPQMVTNVRPSNLEGKAREALREFWQQLTLTQADLDELWRKRGLPAWACQQAGFRTNHRPNRELLNDLRQRFDESVLVESGLWLRGGAGEAKPNSQFYGLGLVRRGKGGADDEWGWVEDGRCNPVIIPYFDSQGQLLHLRPHKGGSAGIPPHLYIARRHGVPFSRCATAVITEGEFKGWALNAALNDNGPGAFTIATMPGISMAKNRTCLTELHQWLKTHQPDRVIIAYDSETKDDPRLTSFQPNPRKRHDAQIWARYLANRLNHDGYDAAVAVLPKAWRSPATGKSDWDSRLAARLAELSVTR